MNFCRLTEEDIGEDSKVTLNFVKYQNVQNLTVSWKILSSTFCLFIVVVYLFVCLCCQVFVQDNQGGAETTVVQYLGLFGSPLDTTNMKEFKRVSIINSPIVAYPTFPSVACQPSLLVYSLPTF